MQTKRQMKDKRLRRKRRIRKNIEGTSERPRLSIYRSNKHIYAQLIDDLTGHTIASASSQEDEVAQVEGDKKEKAKKVGEVIAKRALDKGIDQVVFDRNGYLYHGRVENVANGAREGGLNF